jgi:opacity protein-like surface antigen
MSKLFRGCFALALILIFSTPAICKELDTYMAISGGVALLEDGDFTDATDPSLKGSLEYDPGYFIGLAFGHHVDNIRFEAELGYQKNKVDSSTGPSGYRLVFTDDHKIRLSTLMLNIYYDFMKGSSFTPYLSAGLGLGNMKLDGISKSDAVAEYQFGAGLAFRVSEKIALDLKGRYLSTTDAEFDGVELDFSTINAIFDVRIYF